MDDVLELVFTFVELSQRYARDGALSAEEYTRWLGLGRLLPGDGAVPPPTDNDAPDGQPVDLTGLDGFEAGSLLAISRDGMRVCVAKPAPVGMYTTLRLRLRSGVLYHFPCKVAWATAVAVGLAYDGVPHVGRHDAQTASWDRVLDLRTGWGTKASARA